MARLQYDAIVDIAHSYARVRTLTPHTHCWVETHVTLAQIRLWANGILEVPPHVIGDLLIAMLTAGFKLIPAGGRMIMSPAQVTAGRLDPCVSPH